MVYFHRDAYWVSRRLDVGNPSPDLELPWALVWQGSTNISEPLWRGLGAVPWADCPASTNELIGEDSLGDH